jgi:hypothetical protein
VADRSDQASRWPLPERHERRSGHSSIATSPGYLVPVHADIPTVEAVLLDGNDDAVFNATGVRVRDFAITLEKILPHLPHPPADDDVEERGPSGGQRRVGREVKASAHIAP